MLVLDDFRMEVNGKLFTNIKCYLIFPFNISLKRPQNYSHSSHCWFHLWTSSSEQLNDCIIPLATAKQSDKMVNLETTPNLPGTAHSFRVIDYYLIIRIYKLVLNHRFQLQSNLPIWMTNLSPTPGISMHNLTLKERSYHLSHCYR